MPCPVCFTAGKRSDTHRTKGWLWHGASLDRCLLEKKSLWALSLYLEVLGDQSAMYIRVILYWGYLIVLWLFYLVCVCVGFVMCGCFDNCMGILVICVLVFTVFCVVRTVFLYGFIYSYLLLVWGLLPPSENSIAVNNNNDYGMSTPLSPKMGHFNNDCWYSD
jgi:hypothetical protein